MGLVSARALICDTWFENHAFCTFIIDLQHSRLFCTILMYNLVICIASLDTFYGEFHNFLVIDSIIYSILYLIRGISQSISSRELCP